ncbi:helix-turn-helix domain-containing protein [Sphingopyxis panaciterrae]|uniref:helix-turn-helix domain-containing protein n=1 Tax=Sphingopyxis panaciterrae TaxID=363841 RepID=UPI003C7E12AD
MPQDGRRSGQETRAGRHPYRLKHRRSGGRTGTRTSGRLAPWLSVWQERKAKKMMADHLSRPIDVGELAHSCGVSRGYFISAFCASAGITPRQWLLCARVHQAQEMLLSTDLPLVRIAIDCGFYDQSHFSRAFARRAGVPPGRWRRLNGAMVWHGALKAGVEAEQIIGPGDIRTNAE